MWRQAIEEVMGSLLDRLGSRWKTICGLAAMLAILLIDQAGVFNGSADAPFWQTAIFWWELAGTLTGIGVLHKVNRAERAKKAT